MPACAEASAGRPAICDANHIGKRWIRQPSTKCGKWS